MPEKDKDISIAFFVRVKNWKQLKYPSVEKWLNKMYILLRNILNRILCLTA